MENNKVTPILLEIGEILPRIAELHRLQTPRIEVTLEFKYAHPLGSGLELYHDWYKYIIEADFIYRFYHFKKRFRFVYRFYSTDAEICIEVEENNRMCSFSGSELSEAIEATNAKTVEEFYALAVKELESRKLEIFESYCACSRCGNQDPQVAKYGLELEHYNPELIYCKDSKGCKRRRRKNKRK